MASERTQILTPLFSYTVWEGKLEREKEGERKEGIFRESVSNFSLNFPAIIPSNSGEARSKVAPHDKSYVWAWCCGVSTTPGGRGFLLHDLILV